MENNTQKTELTPEQKAAEKERKLKEKAAKEKQKQNEEIQKILDEKKRVERDKKIEKLFVSDFEKTLVDYFGIKDNERKKFLHLFCSDNMKQSWQQYKEKRQ